MNLAIHASHHGSITIFNNEEIIVHTQIDRFNRFKGHSHPEKKLINKLKKFNFDKVFISSLEDHCVGLWKSILVKNKIINIDDIYEDHCLNHHIYHAYCSALINPTTNCIVCDGRGANKDKQHEYFSIYNNLKNIKTFTDLFTYGLGAVYECVRKEFGWLYGQEGNLMALSTYGKFNKEIEQEIWNGINFNKDIKIRNDLEYKGNIFKNLNEDLAKTTQQICEKVFYKILKENKIEKEISLTGGFAQNIINNTNLLNYYKVNVDPFNSDQGISLGVANHVSNNKLKKLNTVYLGFKTEYDFNFADNFEIKEITTQEVAKIVNEYPVAIFQGRSEQGQRGLGNRSLLINPLTNNCLKKINEIKKREWFRPFAATVTIDKFEHYFYDNKSNGDYMLFTYKIKSFLKDIFKNILSNEYNCRLQILKKEQNESFYYLIKELSRLSGFEIILNTSLNLPGEPLVEDLKDLEYTMDKSNLIYAYLPDVKKLIIKH
jgi:carbamoyltransferase